jgi:hypothetical protein
LVASRLTPRPRRPKPADRSLVPVKGGAKGSLVDGPQVAAFEYEG